MVNKFLKDRHVRNINVRVVNDGDASYIKTFIPVRSSKESEPFGDKGCNHEESAVNNNLSSTDDVKSRKRGQSKSVSPKEVPESKAAKGHHTKNRSPETPASRVQQKPRSPRQVKSHHNSNCSQASSPTRVSPRSERLAQSSEKEAIPMVCVSTESFISTTLRTEPGLSIEESLTNVSHAPEAAIPAFTDGHNQGSVMTSFNDSVGGNLPNHESNLGDGFSLQAANSNGSMDKAEMYNFDDNDAKVQTSRDDKPFRDLTPGKGSVSATSFSARMATRNINSPSKKSVTFSGDKAEKSDINGHSNGYAEVVWATKSSDAERIDPSPTTTGGNQETIMTDLNLVRGHHDTLVLDQVKCNFCVKTFPNISLADIVSIQSHWQKGKCMICGGAFRTKKETKTPKAHLSSKDPRRSADGNRQPAKAPLENPSGPLSQSSATLNKIERRKQPDGNRRPIYSPLNSSKPVTTRSETIYPVQVPAAVMVDHPIGKPAHASTLVKVIVRDGSGQKAYIHTDKAPVDSSNGVKQKLSVASSTSSEKSKAISSTGSVVDATASADDLSFNFGSKPLRVYGKSKSPQFSAPSKQKEVKNRVGNRTGTSNAAKHQDKKVSQQEKKILRPRNSKGAKDASSSRTVATKSSSYSTSTTSVCFSGFVKPAKAPSLDAKEQIPAKVEPKTLIKLTKPGKFKCFRKRQLQASDSVTSTTPNAGSGPISKGGDVTAPSRKSDNDAIFDQVVSPNTSVRQTRYLKRLGTASPLQQINSKSSKTRGSESSTRRPATKLTAPTPSSGQPASKQEADSKSYRIAVKSHEVLCGELELSTPTKKSCASTTPSRTLVAQKPSTAVVRSAKTIQPGTVSQTLSVQQSPTVNQSGNLHQNTSRLEMTSPHGLKSRKRPGSAASADSPEKAAKTHTNDEHVVSVAVAANPSLTLNTPNESISGEFNNSYSKLNRSQDGSGAAANPTPILSGPRLAALAGPGTKIVNLAGVAAHTLLGSSAARPYKVVVIKASSLLSQVKPASGIILKKDLAQPAGGASNLSANVITNPQVDATAAKCAKNEQSRVSSNASTDANSWELCKHCDARFRSIPWEDLFKDIVRRWGPGECVMCGKQGARTVHLGDPKEPAGQSDQAVDKLFRCKTETKVKAVIAPPVTCEWELCIHCERIYKDIPEEELFKDVTKRWGPGKCDLCGKTARKNPDVNLPTKAANSALPKAAAASSPIIKAATGLRQAASNVRNTATIRTFVTMTNKNEPPAKSGARPGFPAVDSCELCVYCQEKFRHVPIQDLFSHASDKWGPGRCDLCGKVLIKADY